MEEALPEAELWIPLTFAPYELAQRGDRAYSVVARLRGGVAPASAQEELRALGRGLAERYPDADAGWVPTMRPLRAAVVGDARASVILLFAATLVLLLAACANVGNLLLARAIARRREVVIRLALGAARPRIVRQLGTETGLLVLVGGAAGLLAADVGVRLLAAVPPDYLPRAGEIHLDAAIVAFALLVSLAAALPLALLPAFHASDLATATVLRAGADQDWRRRQVRARDVLVVAEVALALLLVVGGGLLVRSFLQATAVPLGFSGDDVLAMTISLPGDRYPAARSRTAFFSDLVQRVERLPGVRSAGVTSRIPLAGTGLRGDVAIEDRPLTSAGEVPRAAIVAATPGYFSALRLRVTEGRAFDRRDRDGAPPVVIVDQAFARRFWPAGGGVGRRVRVGATLGADTAWHEIVGIVSAVHLESVVAPPEPTVYLPYEQNPWPTMSLLVRTTADPAAYAAAVRAQVLAIDPHAPCDASSATRWRRAAGRCSCSAASPEPPWPWRSLACTASWRMPSRCARARSASAPPSEPPAAISPCSCSGRCSCA